MTWIATVPPEDADETLQQAYAKVGSRRGAVANIHQAMSLNPEALSASLEFYTSIQFGQSALSRRERELVATVVSRANRCAYCVAHHADALGRHAHEPGLQALVATDYTKADLSPRERAISDHAHKLSVEPSAVGEKDIEILREAGLDDRGILDLTLTAAYANFSSRVALGLGVSHEDVGARYEY